VYQSVSVRFFRPNEAYESLFYSIFTWGEGMPRHGAIGRDLIEAQPARGQGTPHPLNPEQEHLSDILVDYWTTFAKYGAPNAPAKTGEPEGRRGEGELPRNVFGGRLEGLIRGFPDPEMYHKQVSANREYLACFRIDEMHPRAPGRNSHSPPPAVVFTERSTAGADFFRDMVAAERRRGQFTSATVEVTSARATGGQEGQK
jgi:hypothetical protein